MLLRAFRRYVLTGLITLLPVVLTLYLIYWIVVSTESLLGALLGAVLPEGVYRPGMGVVAGLIVAFVAGLLMHALVVRQLFAQSEQFFARLPLIKSVYFAIRDLVDYFSPGRKKDFGQVVAVTVGGTGVQLIGFVTQAELGALGAELGREDSVLVYLPMSYMVGGYTVVMPRSAVRPLNMTMEEAMRFILTAGLTSERAPGAEPVVIDLPKR